MQLRQRDKELLRTMLRLQVVSTQELAEAFFCDNSTASRRLHTLSRQYGLVTVHSKNQPVAGYALKHTFWRLTSAGLRVIEREYPEEPMPENFVDRVSRASLRFWEHRQSVNAVYLHLLGGSFGSNLDQVYERASNLRWAPEYEVVMKARGNRRVVPDATLDIGERRYYLEIDRSTEAHKYVRQSLRDYEDALPVMGRDTVTVLYLTKTKTRATNLRKTMGRLHLPFRVTAIELREGQQRLAERLVEPEGSFQGKKERTTFEVCRLLYDAHWNLCREASAAGIQVQKEPLFAMYEYLQKQQELAEAGLPSVHG